MSERDEERKAALVWANARCAEADFGRCGWGEEIVEAHIAGQICGEQRAAGEIARYEKLMVRDLTELRNQNHEIAALRELVRLADSYMEDFGQWRESPEVQRALEEGR